MPETTKKAKGAQTAEVDIPSIHWADKVAEELAEAKKDDTIVCASGISPSGMVHIGNFREVITTEFVVRALLDRGKKVRFIYSWDDYDAFRKVPKNLPEPEMLEKNLRKPLSLVPDPYGKAESYAAHFEKVFESEIAQLGVEPEYIYQNKRYRSGYYHQGIKEAHAREKDIAAILNKARTEDLEANWSCVSIFCKTCQRDTTEVRNFVAPSTFAYFCKACKKDDTVNFEVEGQVKLLWRVDWPMRWAREKVDFEPGGKDHSSQGGSYDTGKDIIKEVWKRDAPYYVQYDFVLAKGIGSKLSSSSGNLITVGEALEIYEPAVLRWIFASRKPNLDFSIAFDLDVMRAYDDFDRCERYAYGVEEGEEKRVNYERRIYEFAVTKRRTEKKYGQMPKQYPFRHLCNLLQIQRGDFKKTAAYYGIKSSEDTERFEARAKRAWKWIADYAPAEFKFTLQTEPQHKSQYPALLGDVVSLLKGLPDGYSNEDELAEKTFELMKKNGVEPKAFFQDTYKILVNKPNGPKLAAFLLAIGPKQSVDILSKAL